MSKDEKIVERIEDDAPFEVEPFDEKEFIRKELISFRTTLVLFVFSIVVAGITFLIWRYAELRFSILVLIALALGFGLLRFIFKAARIDISHWKRREWIGTLFLYFFFWLGFLLLLVNPPFTDAAAPRIEMDVVPAAQAPGAEVWMGAYIADNKGMSGSPTFCVHRYEGNATPTYESLSESERSACETPWDRLGEGPFWRQNSSYPAGRYAVFALAADGEGRTATQVDAFEVSNPLSVSLPRDNRFAVADDSLTVKVHSKIYARTVQFSLDGGQNWHDFVPHPDATKRAENYWRTEPAYTGWSAGTHNVTLRVITQPVYLRAADHVLRGIAEDAQGPYRLTVDANLPEVGTRAIDYGKDGNRPRTEYGEFRYVNPGQTPGLEVPAILLVLAGLVVAGRRRAA